MDIVFGINPANGAGIGARKIGEPLQVFQVHVDFGCMIRAILNTIVDYICVGIFLCDFFCPSAIPGDWAIPFNSYN